MPETLTKIERRILNYLVDYLKENTYQPSIREIGGGSASSPPRRSRSTCSRSRTRGTSSATPPARAGSRSWG
jgi:SOS-response transcriptional repressor LexA